MAETGTEPLNIIRFRVSNLEREPGDLERARARGREMGKNKDPGKCWILSFVRCGERDRALARSISGGDRERSRWVCGSVALTELVCGGTTSGSGALTEHV